MNKKLSTKNHTSQKGITLIALVVTILVLLILAAVVINTVLGDEGIIARAEDSKKEQIEKEDMEAIKLAVSGQDILTIAEFEIAGYNKADAIETELVKKYGNGVQVEQIANGYRITINEEEGRIYTIDSAKQIAKVGGTSSPVATNTTNPTNTETPVVTNTPNTQGFIITNKLNGRHFTVNSTDSTTKVSYTYQFGNKTLASTSFVIEEGDYFLTPVGSVTFSAGAVAFMKNNILNIDIIRDPAITSAVYEGVIRINFVFTDGTTDTDTFELTYQQASTVPTSTPQTPMVTNKLNGATIEINSNNKSFTHVYDFGNKVISNVYFVGTTACHTCGDWEILSDGNLPDTGECWGRTLETISVYPAVTISELGVLNGSWSNMLIPDCSITSGEVEVVFVFSDGTTDTDTFICVYADKGA